MEDAFVTITDISLTSGLQEVDINDELFRDCDAFGNLSCRQECADFDT